MVAPLKPVRISVGEAVDTYLDTCFARVQVGQISQATLRTYTQHLHLFVSLVGADKVLDDVTGDDVDKALVGYAKSPDRRRKQIAQDVNKRARRGSASLKSPESQNIFHNALSAFFTEAKKRKWVQLSPLEFSSLTPAKSKNRNPARAALSVEQARALLTVGVGDASRCGSARQALNVYRDKAILTLFLLTGVRNGELCAAVRDDFKVSADGAPRWRVYGKGGKERTVPVPADVYALVRDYWARVDAAIADGTLPESADAEAAFLSSRGNALTERGVQNIVAYARARVARFPGTAHLAREIVPHALRHTAATLALANGDVDLPQVRDLLGHANVATTSLYLDADEGALEKVVSANPLRSLGT